MPSLHDIAKEWLEAHGCHGLADEFGECYCTLGDFMPCGSPNAEGCVAGHRVECQCGQDCEYHVAPGLPEMNNTVGGLVPVGLVGNVLGDINEKDHADFLERIKALMVKYRVDRIDLGWTYPHPEVVDKPEHTP
jgi:hypothetical protein